MGKPAPLDNDRPVAVVIGMDCVTGLQTARVLWSRGVPVIAMAKRKSHYCCRSRTYRKLICVDTASAAMIDELVKLGPQLPQRAVLFPCTDMSVLQVSRHREQLAAWYHVMLPAADVVEMLLDKVRFIQFAKDHNLPIPPSFIIANDEDAAQAANDISYPCILKPPVKTPAWEMNTSAKGFVLENAEQFWTVYRCCRDWTDTLLLQEWIPGTTCNQYTCDAYFGADSTPLVTFISRKLRQWPLDTGVGTLGEEIRNDKVLKETIRLFQAAGYRGLGYLEMKRHERTGEHLIIEPNVGRPTGRSTTAEASGVEMLYTMYCDAVGLPLPEARKQNYSRVKWIHMRRDMQAVWKLWRRKEITLRAWLKSIRGRKACAVFSWKDPGPFVGDIASAVRHAFRRVLKKWYGGKGKPSIRLTASRQQPQVGRTAT